MVRVSDINDGPGSWYWYGGWSEWTASAKLQKMNVGSPLVNVEWVCWMAQA